MSENLHEQYFELRLGDKLYREGFCTGAGEILLIHPDKDAECVISDTPRKVMAFHFRLMREAMSRGEDIHFKSLTKTRAHADPLVPKPRPPGMTRSPNSKLPTSTPLPTDDNIYIAKISGNTFPHRTVLNEARFFYRREWGNGEWRKYSQLAHNLRAYVQLAARLNLNFDWEIDTTSRRTEPQTAEQQELDHAEQN